MKTNITLIFGLNACYGRESRSSAMNFTNIENLLKYTNTIDTMNKNLFGFELGNELQASIDAGTYANDFYTLYKLISNISNSNGGGLSLKAIGNDDYDAVYTSQFLSNLSNIISNDGEKSLKWDNNEAVLSTSVSDVIYRLTYHHYPNCNYPSSNNGSVFDLSCLESIHSVASDYNSIAGKYSNLEAWMGEGSEHSGGGTANVSNTMIDNFYYVYQLSTVLTYGIYGTIRSDLTGGDYELIDHITFEPNPDYWILYVWKQLIGDKLYYSTLLPSDGNVRVFGFSLKNDENSIVLAAINFDMQNSAMINVEIETNGGNSNNYNCVAYYIKPKGNTIQSRMIYVNDVLMQYQNGVFPQIESVTANADYITLDPARIAFLVYTVV